MIEEVACGTEYRELYPVLPWNDPADVFLGSGFNAENANRFQRYRLNAATRHIVERHVVLDTVSGLVLRNGMPLPWSCYFGKDDGRVPFQVADALSKKKDDRMMRGKRVYCGFNAFYRNYAHWITQCVPAIAGYALEPEFSNSILLLPNLPQGYEDAFRLAGIELPKIWRIDGNSLIEIEELVYSSHLQNFSAPSYHNQSVFRQFNSEKTTDYHAEKIYVWRIDTPNRPMINETELVRILVENGFLPVIGSSMSIEEKINCFRNAKLVVGAHGAGLANVAFCKPGTAVYELSPEHHIDLHTGFAISVVAQTCSLHYWADAFPSHGSFANFGHYVPWTGDIQHILARIDEISLRYGLST